MFKSLADAEAAALDLKIHKISVPTPYPGLGPVNFYFIEDSRPALIDTGMNYKFEMGFLGGLAGPGGPATKTEGGREILDRTLKELGYTVRDIDRIYLTHGHPDHMGMAAQIVRENKGEVPVYVQEGDMRYALASSPEEVEERRPEMLSFFQMLGMPQDIMDMMRMMREAAEKDTKPGAKPAGMSAMGDPHGSEPLDEVFTYDEGDTVEFDRFTLTLLHTPGHTAGQSCLHDPVHKLLFTGDHILPETSPIALPDFGSSDLGKGKLGSLLRYINNVRRVENMDIDIIFPGHGKYILDHRDLISGLFKFYDRRQQKILKIVDDLDEPTTYDIAKALFPKFNPMIAFLALTEAAGHLEVLEDRGALEITSDGAPIRYRTMG